MPNPAKLIALLLTSSAAAVADGSDPGGVLVAQAAGTVSGEPKPPPKPEVGGLAGWNGEHFFLQTPDGYFTLQPYAYVQTDFRIYSGDGVPPNTFTIRRARLGFQGKLDKYYEFAFLGDFVDTTSALLRDAFVNVRFVPEVQFTVGQFVEPFGQEAASTGVTNIDFVERGLTSMLYPAASGSFRSPGAMVHGDILKGTLSYWVGAFNGKGPLAANTTSEPEVIGRLRVYPFRLAGDSPLQGLAFGGAYGHGRTRGLSNEMSFSGFVPDRPFALVPQTLINGQVDRFNLEATLLFGPAGIRAEYDQLRQFRRGLDVGFTNLPRVRGRAFNIDATFLLTGERRPENGQPKATSPLFGRDGSFGIGAWEVKGRYSYLDVDAPGDPKNGFPDIANSVDELSAGLNWYPTNLVRYALDFNLYRVKDAATVGGAVPQNFLVVLQRVQFKF